MKKILFVLSLLAFSSCGKQTLADRDDYDDDRRYDHRDDRRYDRDDRDRDDRDRDRPWWWP